MFFIGIPKGRVPLAESRGGALGRVGDSVPSSLDLSGVDVVVVADKAVKILDGFFFVVDLSTKGDRVTDVKSLFAVVVHDAAGITAAHDAADNARMRPEDVANGFADDEGIFGNFHFKTNDAAANAVVLNLFHVFKDAIVEGLAVEDLGREVDDEDDERNIEHIGELCGGFDEECRRGKGCTHRAAHKGAHCEKNHGAEKAFGHTDGDEKLSRKSAEERADGKGGDEDAARDTAGGGEEHHAHADHKHDRKERDGFFTAYDVKNDASAAVKTLCENETDDTCQKENKEDLCIIREEFAEFFHQLTEFRNGDIENADSKGNEDGKEQDVACVLKLQFFNDAQIKKNGIDVKETAECVVDSRCRQNGTGCHQNEHGREALVDLFQRENDRGEGRSRCYGECRCRAACHDVAVPCALFLGGLAAKVTDCRTDEDAGAFAAKRNTAEKADHAAEDRAEKGADPLEGKHAAQDTLTSRNTAALGFGGAPMQEIHDRGKADQSCKKKDLDQSILLCHVIDVLGDLFQMLR